VTPEPEWLLEPAILTIHSMLIVTHGGTEGLRDPGLLDSVLARPKNLFAYTDPPPSLFELAAGYAYGLVKNHCFLDGNKRIVLTAALTFLDLNGYRLEAPQAETYSMMIGLATGDVTETAFSAWLAGHCERIAAG
jgi:death-on-curing protein